jgi:multicomponent Na+:H+ antiporter subunit D
VSLAIPLVIPWLLAVALSRLDGRRPAIGWLAVGGLGLALAGLLALGAVVLARGPVDLVTGGWPPGVGITLRAEPLGLLFAVVSVTVLLAALGHEVLAGVHERTLPALVLFLGAGLIGLFLTADAFNFYVFFEVSMIASFVLASYGRREREARAALVFAVVNLLGSAFLLAAIAGLYHLTGTLDMRAVAERLRATDPAGGLLIAVLVFVALSLKLGLFPFHFWLPPIYRDSWPAVAAVLSGAVANIGSYGLLRFGAGLLPAHLDEAAPALLALGALSLVYGAHQAVSVRSTGEMLAYSAVGQAGYVLLALGVGGAAGLSAAVLYALVNALNKALLFLASGVRGRGAEVAFAVGAVSVVGLPPAAGFFGKVALFDATLAAGHAALVALVFLGGALSFVYMFQAYQRHFWRPAPEDVPSPWPVRLVALGLAALVVALGVWPEPLLAASRLAVGELAGPAVTAPR